MNKELIKKYKAEFDHWLNGGQLLVCDVDEKIWVSLNVGHWTINPKMQYIVINDKYIEFRKALAEGKTIQCNARENETDITFAAYGDTWWKDTTEFKYATCFYRIKPEEPQFKVGDFIKNNVSNSIRQYSQADLEYDKKATHINNWELWKPEVGELCWFTNNLEGNTAKLAPYHSTDHNYFKEKTMNWKYCEPFLNSKPSWFKD